VVAVTLQVVRRWFSRLPPYELDMPIVVVDGLAYTPRAILEEVQRGTALGERLQRMVEAGVASLHQEDLDELAKLRLRLLLSRPTHLRVVAYTYPVPREMTMQELLAEVEAGTPIGRRFIEAQKEVVMRLLSMR
jgi:hypothetical protein